MEDLIIILIVGAIYFLRSMAQEGDTTKQQTTPEAPYEEAPQPVRQAEHYREGNSIAPDTFSEAPLLPTTRKKWSIATSPTPSRLTPKKRVGTVLRRYGTWQRAIIIHELLHPLHQR